MASPRPARSFAPDHALSTAPASPTDDMQHESGKPDVFTTTTTSYAPGSTVGTFEYEDAVEETIVKTIKRTRTIFPPLITPAPADLEDRDPRQYVLAHTETPGYLRKVQVEQDGRTFTLQEAENPAAALRDYKEKQRRLQQHGGVLRDVIRAGNHETPVRGFRRDIGDRKVQARESNGLKRTATPLSGDAAELGSLERKIKKPRSQLHRTASALGEHPPLERRFGSGSFAVPAHSSPITPDTEAGAASVLQARPNGTGKKRPSVPAFNRAQRTERSMDVDTEKENDVDMEGMESPEDDSQLGPPTYGKHKRRQRQAEASAVAGASRTVPGASTPSVKEDELEVEQEPRRPGRQRPQLHNILTSSQLDASLPSPSLSPITAAANAASRNRNRFEESFAQHNEENASFVSGFDLDEGSNVQNGQSHQHQKAHAAPQSAPGKPNLTMQDIPRIIEFVDTLPDQVQKYVLYQLLRRSKKPVLQMVANVVNPALKCDPFNVLPDEIGLNIVSFLDVHSMCRAACVSKRWREIINTDETAWKDLLSRDDFVLPRDEIKAAIEQGWGWQIPGEDGSEQDLREYIRRQQVDSDDEETGSSVAIRSKKRSGSKQTVSKKSKQRKPIQQPSLASSKPTISEPWRKKFRSAQGPRDFHDAAIEAMPRPETTISRIANGLDVHPAGVPSLKNMHLFKALYQRHYLIRKAWMKEEILPQHLAFRAHHRHVVTCLLFDSEKILTGSDDTKICVYDTKTGALRMRLEGHEGGVWALQYVGDTLVSGSTDRTVRVWDIKTGRCLQTFQGHTSTVRCLVILQPVVIGTDLDGKEIKMPPEPLIITGSRDSTLRVWKLPKPSDRTVFEAGPTTTDRDNPYFLRCLSGHHNSVRAIAAHGDTLISGSYDCTVRVWKISTGDLLHRLQGHTQKVYSVVLDHARGRCISGSMDNLVKVWDLQSGACLFNLEGHTSLVGLLDLSSDRLVSAAADSTLRIWDPENGACKATLSAHTGAITCFQHDGQKVISGSDRTLKMWNVRTGECVRDLLTDLSGVWQVRFDERRCVAAVQRNNYTYIEVLDFGASRDGATASERGRRIFVDSRGRETIEVEATAPAVPAEAGADAAA